MSVDIFHRIRDTFAVDIADRNDPGIGIFDGLRHVVVSGDAARSDGTDVQPVAGGVLPEYGSRYDGRETSREASGQAGLH